MDSDRTTDFLPRNKVCPENRCSLRIFLVREGRQGSDATHLAPGGFQSSLQIEAVCHIEKADVHLLERFAWTSDLLAEIIFRDTSNEGRWRTFLKWVDTLVPPLVVSF